MSAIRYGETCAPSVAVMPDSLLGAMGLTATPEPTHDGCSGGQTRPGVLGGWTCPCKCHTQSDADSVATYPATSESGHQS